MKQTALGLYITYWIIVAIDCVLLSFEAEAYRYFTRGLLMPVLFLILISETKQIKFSRSRIIVCLALLFSWIGDLILTNITFEDSPFVAGLIAFLIAHIFYIIFFTRMASFREKNIITIFLSGFFITCYAVGFIAILWSRMEKLRVPIIVYTLVLGYMLLRAINTVGRNRLKSVAPQNFLPGALFFLISDSLLAFNIFFLNETGAGIAVIITYAIAQFLLVKGAIKYVQK
jgi:uncharacterized membrane protein YhhN